MENRNILTFLGCTEVPYLEGAKTGTFQIVVEAAVVEKGAARPLIIRRTSTRKTNQVGEKWQSAEQQASADSSACSNLVDEHHPETSTSGSTTTEAIAPVGDELTEQEMSIRERPSAVSKCSKQIKKRSSKTPYLVLTRKLWTPALKTASSPSTPIKCTSSSNCEKKHSSKRCLEFDVPSLPNSQEHSFDWKDSCNEEVFCEQADDPVDYVLDSLDLTQELAELSQLSFLNESRQLRDENANDEDSLLDFVNCKPELHAEAPDVDFSAVSLGGVDFGCGFEDVSISTHHTDLS